MMDALQIEKYELKDINSENVFYIIYKAFFFNANFP